MRLLFLVLLAFVAVAADASNDKVFLLSKRQIVNSTHTLVVFFHDREVTDISGCQREIQRGNRGQWRYYNHRFPRPRGYSENIDYHCVAAKIDVGAWQESAPYDLIYQIDIRTAHTKVKLMKNYAECLHNLRRQVHDETRTFFCAKLSQKVEL